jgi:hypothetical protein
VPRKRAAPKPARTRERFADGRAERYAEQGTHVELEAKPNRTSIRCPVCAKGYGLAMGAQGRRVLLECEYCNRRWFPNQMERP